VSTVIWRFTDGKAGHDRQSQGLVRALQQRVDTSVFHIAVEQQAGGFRYWLSRRYPAGSDLPAPDLLLGAGHTTHWHMLAARRCRGGRIIVLMKPSLPLSWFDLCLVPEHDGPLRGSNVLPTVGVLNDIQPGSGHDNDTGLIVLGGPSRHFHWNSDQILLQLAELVKERPVKKWLLTTSRRTPQALVQSLAGKQAIECVPFSAGANAWLPAALAKAGEVWVSEDSVSMICEALTAGAKVGLLKVQHHKNSRVGRAVDALVDSGWVGSPGRWQPAAGLQQPLNEAARCADWIKQQWLDP
jgi:mitochondrial fission protein ELM1